jgi:threonine/homoserine/homoserine lactone efflux protein
VHVLTLPRRGRLVTLAAGIDGGGAAALVVSALAIMGSPGPATISLTALGSTYGVRRSLPYLTGIVAGTAAVLLAVATGLTATLLAVPALRFALLALSVAYILRLAYHVATAPPLVVKSTTSPAPAFAGGAVLGVTNPKAWVAIAAVFAGATLSKSAGADAAAKIAVLTAMIVVINAAWLAAGAALTTVLYDARRARVMNVTLAVALVAATAIGVVH